MKKVYEKSLVCMLASVIGMTAFHAPLSASPIQEYECLIGLPTGPLPTDSLEFKYTIRRHVVDTVPFEETNTSIWDQARFQENGEFELDIFLISGEMFTEHSTGTRTSILDGQGAVRDEIFDEAESTETKIKVEDFVVEDFSLTFIKNDGSVISDHLRYPEFIDPGTFDRAECIVNWRVPNGGVVCQVLGGGSAICTHGSHKGIIISTKTLPHDEDHGSPFVINAGLNDAWVSPDAPLQGLFITYFPELNIVFLSWFTFDSEQPPVEVMATFAAPDQRWVTAVGSANGNRVEMKAELTTGGLFNASDPVPVQDTNYGTIDIEFSGCKAGKVTFDFPSTGESGEFNIQRAVESNADLCAALTTQ